MTKNCGFKIHFETNKNKLRYKEKSKKIILIDCITEENKKFALKDLPGRVLK